MVLPISISHDVPDDPDAPATLVIHAPDAEKAMQWITVMHAVHIQPHVEQLDGDWYLHIPPDQAERAVHELSAYEDEMVEWDELVRTSMSQPVALKLHPAAPILAVLLVAFHLGPGRIPLWREAGMNYGRAVLDGGEWWRTATSLTLHGDLSHVLGNAVGLWFIGGLLCRRLGAGVGLLTILLAGMLGNYGTDLYEGIDHRAVGASTALFAAFGIAGMLQALAAIRKSRRQLLRRLGIPLVAVFAILAFLGSANPDGNTDVMAHLAGVGAGLLLAVPAFLLERFSRHQGLQVSALLAMISLLVVAWFTALQTASAGAGIMP